MKIGVLALQGDFAAHCQALKRAGAESREVRTAEEIDALDGLVLPGGESTTMLRLMDNYNLFGVLRDFGREKPIYGTCAGAILLASVVTSPAQRSLRLMDIEVERNAYGRQVDSRIERLPTDFGEVEAVFIRAPIIRKVGSCVRVLASYQGDPVWIEEGLHTVTTFHPELTSDAAVYRRFLARVIECSNVTAAAR
jgi:5'-phosphate synthase pdxT subunit